MSSPPVPTVTLYRRPGCGLCDEAERLLARLAQRLRFTIECVDIEADATLHQRYLLEIPVIAVDGREVARAPLSGPVLEALLADAFAAR